ncbi:hypothetical protein [Kutzneria buriramensis]|uniref:Uncharacterized protein n=1 Tax=Kutzneria buriramensis TaxID=1045776 RepID=A0A3E0HIF0_9PSEU|nr:hypothetical protein [Kutzneria buriramensis]REH46130.1 hypothetical protein BCF44_107263 [Kutzneria buriramensis]
MLSDAIARSGLTLERVADAVAARGGVLAVSTLSHWRSGRSMPTRRGSLVVVGHLEDVLGLESGSLRLLAKPAYRGGRPTVESRMSPVAASFSKGGRVRELLGEVDMRSDERLMRLSQHDRCRIGPDRAKESLLVRQVLRATEDGADRFVIAFWHDTSQPLPQLVALRGCRVGHVVRDPAAAVLVAELLFTRPLECGETIVTEHELRRLAPAPDGAEDCYGRSLRHPTRECLLEVDFDPDTLPVRCEQVAEPENHSQPATRRALTVDSDCRVHALANGFGPGVVEIRWTWS